MSRSECEEKCLKKIKNGKMCFGYDYNEQKDKRCRVFYVYPFDQKSHDEVDCWLATGTSSITYPTPSGSVNKADDSPYDKHAPEQPTISFTKLKKTACGFDGTAKEDIANTGAGKVLAGQIAKKSASRRLKMARNASATTTMSRRTGAAGCFMSIHLTRSLTMK